MGVPEKTAPLHSVDAAQPAPPAYDQNQPPPAYVHSESSTTRQPHNDSQHSGSSPQPQHMRFPSQFNVYTQFSTFTIGPHQDEKLFTVVQTRLWKPMALVQGDDKKAPPLSTIMMKGMGSTSVLSIFPDQGGEVSKPLEITIENHSTKHCFCIALPRRTPHFFEWRSSKSEEVQALGAYKRGWKLVWLRKDGGGGEIVAASALNNTMSLKKGLKFGFFNAGLDGTLGDTFHIAAVTTAMNDFEMFLSTNVAIVGNASTATA
ncbi:hypothetical protein P171DRAFT_435550 [Karstenula rhodostoma CBS 690.94]|uniref:Uncharacterized protein n=1 Tax=Karstenula rhodostoma CBS 690.94 TaxID=1392251 RepID=A0A9P4PBI6_9PLEO|nr:hypothetical protein P171DRAFT_435550 [Karstenula rhodostoma CBS 690.94]